VQTLRELHDAGKLDALTAKLLFSPTRPAEELYEWTLDRWQVRNLAADSAHLHTLESLRAQLERWMIETNDHGPESERMYDSDMAVYLEEGKSYCREKHCTVEKNGPGKGSKPRYRNQSREHHSLAIAILNQVVGGSRHMTG